MMDLICYNIISTFLRTPLVNSMVTVQYREYKYGSMEYIIYHKHEQIRSLIDLAQHLVNSVILCLIVRALFLYGLHNKQLGLYNHVFKLHG